MDVLRRNNVLNPRIKRSRSIIEREEGNQEHSSNNNHQLVIYTNSFKNNSLCYAWNAYFDKNKIKKNIMVCCDLNKICDDILKGVENNSLTIKTFSFLLIGVCNIYKKKVYFIGQDYDFLKRKILSLYKNKDSDLNDPTLTSKDSKRRKIGKDNEDDSNKNGSKKRLNRNSLNIKRGSLSMNEFIPSVMDDFTARRSRFSLNADEISIAGTQNNGYNDMFNDNEMNNQMLMDISGINYLNFDTGGYDDNDNINSNDRINNNHINVNNGSISNRSSMGNYHVMEKALDGSYISRNSIPMNNFDGLNSHKSLSEAFNDPMDNFNIENSILNNMIPKNMFPNLEDSMNERSNMMGEFNNLELNSMHRSDGFNCMNRFNDGSAKLDNAERGNFLNDYTNVGNEQAFHGYNNGMDSFHQPFGNINAQENENGIMLNSNNRNNLMNNFSGIISPSRNLSNVPYNLSPGNKNFMGMYNNMNTSMNNRNDLWNLNPFMSMHSLNNNNVDPRNNYPHFSQRIPNHNKFGDLDMMSNVMVGSMFSPQKKKNMSKKNDYLGALNFESYHNFDYFDQKDDDAFIKKLNTLLGLDDDEEEKEAEKGKVNKPGEDKGVDDGNNINDEEGKQKNSKITNAEEHTNNQLLVIEGQGKDKDKEEASVLNESSSNQLVGKKRKLEKHTIDKNYMIKDSVMKTMIKNESVDYKHFLIDTINNEINEMMQKEYPSFNYFFLQTSNDKIRAVHKLEINFGYESMDCEKKKKIFESYLACSANNKSFLYENKSVFDHFSIKKCLDNIDDSIMSNDNDTLSNHFLSFDGIHEEGTMKSDNNMMMNFEEVREQFDGMQFDMQNVNYTNEYKNRFSIDPSLSQNDQIDLNLNDLNLNDLNLNNLNLNDLNVNDLNVNDLNAKGLNEKDDMGYSLHLESQMSKSLVIQGENGITEKNDEMSENGNFLNDRLNSEFDPSTTSPLNLSITSNYDFSNVFTKDNESSVLDDKNVQIDINLNQDFDLIVKELLEVYKNLSTKINYIFFDLITKNRKSKDEISVLFYITLHLANLGYIHIVQKPILPDQLASYSENFSRPILIQYVGQRDE
ncbi:hypothetical protein, conserved [Plasmodium gonderi]|uniref:Rad21/Rec8-like protein N-terminal domain-containing protein n=1 Tax=Plasmodium gonderi TaxID=77519 RepID=A0A1Y1JMI6_PLAGO|nr:hypothetical protein, conserved [Plasmodium gonderi]GAW82685.1 hypothetical protein, conserved [Plasmodium gonderi]